MQEGALGLREGRRCEYLVLAVIDRQLLALVAGVISYLLWRRCHLRQVLACARKLHGMGDGGPIWREGALILAMLRALGQRASACADTTVRWCNQGLAML